MRVQDYNEKEANEITDSALEALARCLYPAIRSYFESEEGQREFDEWKSSCGIENPSEPTEETQFPAAG